MNNYYSKNALLSYNKLFNLVNSLNISKLFIFISEKLIIFKFVIVFLFLLFTK